jgi:predicted amidohydrolase YtcJ
MTKDEALRLALRAMVVNNQAWKHLADSGDAGFWEAEEQGFYQLNEQAIKAVEAALKAKDEPVAWRDAAIRLGEELSSVGPDGYYDMDAKEWLDWAMEQNPRGKHSLPQRTWVGLDEKDFSAINQSCLTKLQAATSAESILKEKNT